MRQIILISILVPSIATANGVTLNGGFGNSYAPPNIIPVNNQVSTLPVNNVGGAPNFIPGGGAVTGGPNIVNTNLATPPSMIPAPINNVTYNANLGFGAPSLIPGQTTFPFQNNFAANPPNIIPIGGGFNNGGLNPGYGLGNQAPGILPWLGGGQQYVSPYQFGNRFGNPYAHRPWRPMPYRHHARRGQGNSNMGLLLAGLAGGALLGNIFGGEGGLFGGGARNRTKEVVTEVDSDTGKNGPRVRRANVAEDFEVTANTDDDDTAFHKQSSKDEVVCDEECKRSKAKSKLEKIEPDTESTAKDSDVRTEAGVPGINTQAVARDAKACEFGEKDQVSFCETINESRRSAGAKDLTSSKLISELAKDHAEQLKKDYDGKMSTDEYSAKLSKDKTALDKKFEEKVKKTLEAKKATPLKSVKHQIVLSERFGDSRNTAAEAAQSLMADKGIKKSLADSKYAKQGYAHSEFKNAKGNIVDVWVVVVAN